MGYITGNKTVGCGGLRRFICIVLAGILAFACAGACADAGWYTDPESGISFPIPDGWKDTTDEGDESRTFTPENTRLAWVMFEVSDMWAQLNEAQVNVSREAIDAVISTEQLLTSLADASEEAEIKTKEVITIGNFEFARVVAVSSKLGLNFNDESLSFMKNGYLVLIQYYGPVDDDQSHDEFMYMLEHMTMGDAGAENAVAEAAQEAAVWDFELRKGVHFGDTQETVLERETLTQIVDAGGRIAYGDLQFTGTVVGIDDTLASYYIDPARGVTEMLYRFKPETSEETTATYQMLLGMLKQKYGEPLPDGSDGKLLKGSVVQGITGYQEIAEWLVPDSSGSVKIELIRVDMVLYETIVVRFVWIDYTAFPDAAEDAGSAAYEEYMNEL